MRDLTDMLLPEDQVKTMQEARAQQAQQDRAAQQEMLNAQVREALAAAYKNIAQGQKNTAAKDATMTNTALDILERGLQPHDQSQAAGPGTGK